MKTTFSKKFIVSVLAASMTGALPISVSAEQALTGDKKEATNHTMKANEKINNNKNYMQGAETELQNAKKGLIDPGQGFLTKIDDDSKMIMPLKEWYSFLNEQDTPDTVNPSLWKNAQMNWQHGLFQVVEGVYQVRGYDLANITFIETDNGWLVLDTGTTAEAAKYAKELLDKNLGAKPIKAIVYSHSHVDHFGGVKGLVSEEQIKSGEVKIYAPAGFMKEAISENVSAGTAMSRRSNYQSGSHIEKGPKGTVDTGIGKATGSGEGKITLIAPTDTIQDSFSTVKIDGLEVQFQLTPGTEAPAEMNVYVPKFNTLFAAENISNSLHNVYTIRGAQIRDALGWSKYIDQAIQLFPDTQYLIAAHGWPQFGKEDSLRVLGMHRDVYRYIHDATLNLLNKGYTIDEVGRMVQLPEALQAEWTTHGYYGSVPVNAKAVAQRYLGFYDANPANLNKILPEESAKKYVEYMGGSAKIIEKAKKDYEKGDYWWVAELMNKVIFAEPDNKEAKYLAADALEQIGYQTESAIHRNAYLVGANELRHGVPASSMSTSSVDVINAMTLDMILDYTAIRFEGLNGQNMDLTMNIQLSDGSKESAYVFVKNGVLNYRISQTNKDADVTITAPKMALNLMLASKDPSTKGVTVTGDTKKLQQFLNHLSTFKPDFNIVTP